MNRQSPQFRASLLTLAIGIAWGMPPQAAGSEEFDQDFMNPSPAGSSDRLDLNAVLQKREMPPGQYLVSVWVNRDELGQYMLDFRLQAGKLVPCLPTSLLQEAGLSRSALDTFADAHCASLTEHIAGATIAFDSQKLKLMLQIPQRFLDTTARGYIDPAAWDDGINALLVNYQLAAARVSAKNSRSSENKSAYLDGGFNFYGFHLRSSASWNDQRHWQTYNTYVEKDLPGTLGSAQAGELFTGGDVMESVPFRGVQFGSVVQMLPDSMQGYSPVIRGVANSQAKVEIKQHGYSLYTTWVPPGPFEIRDLNTASGNGDLEVTITEADGSVRQFTQPFATLGNLLRQGTWRYNIAMGKYQSHSGGGDFVQPVFGQLSGARGMGHDITLAAGATISDMFQKAQISLGKNLGQWGAVALETAWSRTHYRELHKAGQSYSLRYGKAFDSGTNVRFASYRHSTEGYRSFTEAVNERHALHLLGGTADNERNRLEVSLTQNLGEGSAFYMNVYQQTWWHSARKSRQIQSGFTTMLGILNVGMYLSRTFHKSQNLKEQDTELSLTLSVPLGRMNVTASGSRHGDGDYSENVGLNGSAGQHSQFSYNLNLQHQQQQKSTEYAASGGWLTSWAQLNAGVSRGPQYHSGNMSASGSLLMHAGGVEFSQRLGDTVGLVEVDHTPGVRLQNAPTAVTNSRGYALVPYLRPYRANRVLLDTRNVDNRVDIDGRVQQVYPRQGAIVALRYRVTKNQRLLAQLKRQDGSYVPFGAAISDEKGNELTLVGQAGQALINLPEAEKRVRITASWGISASQRCAADITVDGAAHADGLNYSTAACRGQVSEQP
ncbi:fimbria/pilus outer membrane usher protein [Pantoea sp. 1.19]|uniref:fimbria/pilus outer membrane usher protein n=1 Tax=Pantoea sp. 1.19 TaxID=1925589 RepID=UPI0009489839|nr:fimbria/pilus outer membrane usher protein [Pantoea sp. 1.19]